MTAKKQSRLLIVDDEVELTRLLCNTLAENGYETVGATSGTEGLKALEERHFDLLLCDLTMPGMDGVQVLRRAMTMDPTLVGILMTGHATIAAAVDAMKAGAFDFVLKPFNQATLLPILARALETLRLRTENVHLRRYVARLTYESPRYELIGTSSTIQEVVQFIEKVAPTDATVLVCGESGTGKELVARALHYNSPRRGRSLVTVNCATLQASLLESEVFGHEKGAFTGAQQAKPGLIEAADGGTFFIDEVAEMAPALQAKLLRLLGDGYYRRVGGTKECHANVRVVAATNKQLEVEQNAGRFREDLYYRLNVITIRLPPLRERREDVPLLVEHFLTTRQLGTVRCQMGPDVLRALQNYDWPGNIRELANVLERAQILAKDQLITMDDLPDNFRAAPLWAEVGSLDTLNLSELECGAVRMAMWQAKGNKTRAAKILGITRRALYRLIRRHGLEEMRAKVLNPAGGGTTRQANRTAAKT
jgi:DNA-binding NtrC family response regulator